MSAPEKATVGRPAVRDRRSPKEKRFARYPRLHNFLAALAPEQLEAVRKWHAFMTDGLRGFTHKYPAQANLLGSTKSEKQAALDALNSFGRVLAQVGAITEDLRPADWCCPAGMLAYPDPCKKHSEPEIGEVRWVGGKRRVWLVDGWHHWGARIPEEDQRC